VSAASDLWKTYCPGQVNPGWLTNGWRLLLLAKSETLTVPAAAWKQSSAIGDGFLPVVGKRQDGLREQADDKPPQ